jgi:DNA-binding beta-propeller fold protein YncE
MATGDLPLGFMAARVAIAARDRALAVVERAPLESTRVALIPSVAALVQSPKSVTPMMVTLDGVQARTAVFAPDGKRLYVLGGGAASACGPTLPAANSIVLLGADGATQGKWPLGSFVSDLAIDPQSGVLYVSESTKGAVSTIDPATPDGPAGPARLFPATCPTAIGVQNGEVFVVTEDTDPRFQGAFVLKRASIKGGTPTALPFSAPSYQVPINDQSTPDMLTNINLQLSAATLEAYEMAIAPDASRMVFATKARYRELGERFKLSSFDCMTNADIVEYGLYTLDTRTGNAAYDPRSQLVLTPMPSQACITCNALVLGLTLTIKCPAAPGDRPAGVAAVFGTP